MKRVTELYCFVTTDPESGNEMIPSVCGPLNGREVLTPLIAVNIDHMKALMPLAKDWATKKNQEIRLLRFTDTSQIEVIAP